MSAIKFAIMALAISFSLSPTLSAQTPPASPPASSPTDSAVYGKFPENYKEIIVGWLGSQLLDASSAKVEWMGEPKPAEMAGVDGKPLRGYRVDFKVNSRNRFGSYTGMQKHGVLIRDGEVIKGVGFAY